MDPRVHFITLATADLDAARRFYTEGLGWEPLVDVPGDSPTLVDETVEALLSAGGSLVTAPRFAAFGGYHAHIADPNGVIWEIAHNPAWNIDDTGAVSLGQ